ncbi:unnamed protein product [Urochloa decumbens]|uniref:non-specific serine/threonine protein kinase n=1 Tax=Urochloa decumbens TaxID=240449 RepID=A0ABC9BAC2_9POAL
MDYPDNELEAMERVLNDTNEEPIMLSYTFLKNVTNNFAEVIGSGGFGIVYMGVVRNWKLAVKKLYEKYDFSDKQFEEELTCLIRVKHKNIVRFLGYCSETQRKVEQHNGRFILADIRQRFLCFEYISDKSLYDYLKDESHKCDWDTTYQIIQGICQGLRYLHNEERINHLDLKPDNILLDGDMVPKITDFGLSRHFSDEYSRIITQTIGGTLGYTAPEYLNNGEISFKSDIFSLGVIMKQLLRGSMDLSDFENWQQLLDNNDIHRSQVKRCIRIAQLCVDDDQHRRPTIDCITDMLNKETVIETTVPQDFDSSRDSSRSTLHVNSDLSQQLPGIDNPRKLESTSKVKTILTDFVAYTLQVSSGLSQLLGIDPGKVEPSSEASRCWSSKTSKMLDVHPLELRYPWEPNQRIGCPVSLTNRTDRYVGVWITPTCPDTFFDFLFPVLKWPQTEEGLCSPLFHIMKPHSTWVVSVTMKKQPQPPLRDKDKFEVLMIATGSAKEDIEHLALSIGNKPNIDDNLLKQIKKLGGEVHRTMLSAGTCYQPANQAVISHQIISTRRFGSVYSLDVHPTETWILTGHRGGYVSIWNYHTQERVMALQVKKGYFYKFDSTSTSVTSCIYTAKFIAKNQWFAIGDDNGWVHVYNYTTRNKVEGFEAHDGKPINSLAVHPTYPMLLSSSHFDSSIKLWDWDHGWVCARTFDGHAGSGVLQLRLNQRDPNTFASVDTDDTAKVWNIHSSRPITTLVGSSSVDFLFNDSHRDFLVTCGLQTCVCAEIWDLRTEERVHTLAVDGQSICNLACHPTLPTLVTMLLDGTVCLWDATTYSLWRVSLLTRTSHGVSNRVVLWTNILG